MLKHNDTIKVNIESGISNDVGFFKDMYSDIFDDLIDDGVDVEKAVDDAIEGALKATMDSSMAYSKAGDELQKQVGEDDNFFIGHVEYLDNGKEAICTVCEWNKL